MRVALSLKSKAGFTSSEGPAVSGEDLAEVLDTEASEAVPVEAAVAAFSERPAASSRRGFAGGVAGDASAGVPTGVLDSAHDASTVTAE